MNSKSSFLLVFFALAAANHHEDLIVAVGDRIEVLSNGSQSRLLKLDSYNASVLVGLAFDPSSQKLFFSDRRHHRGHVFSVDFDGIKTNGPVHDVVERGSNQSVEGLAFDSVEKALFWTDGLKQSVHRIVLDREDLHVKENNTNELIHLLPGDKPRGLVLDHCNRMIYWTNWNIDRPSIERSHINGSFREVIVHQGLFMPHGLDLDMNEQTIYWANNLRHGSFKIESSNVDGSGRQLIYEGKGVENKGQFIFGLTVGKDYLYWTDWDQKSLWSLPKEGSREGPVALRRYEHKPMAIVLLQSKPIVCQPTTVQTKQTGYPSDQTRFHATTAPAETSMTSMDTDSDLCSGYCMNQGHCFFINDDIKCSCRGSFTGERCEKDTSLQQEKENVTVAVETHDVSFELATTNNAVFAALITLSVTCIILIIAVIYLSFRLRSLSQSKSSRLKRRIIKQEKNHQLGERGIDIEECCNMNICETPCTEPPSGASLPGQSGDRVKLLNCQF